MSIAKLFVPSGTPLHDNCGDTFWPTQLGLVDKLLATFLGIIWPSLKVVDVKVNGSAACTASADARTIAAAAIIFRRSRCENIKNPPCKKDSEKGLRLRVSLSRREGGGV